MTYGPPVPDDSFILLWGEAEYATGKFYQIARFSDSAGLWCRGDTHVDRVDRPNPWFWEPWPRCDWNIVAVPGTRLHDAVLAAVTVLELRGEIPAELVDRITEEAGPWAN